MFERYTEKARRSVFFARYEASQYGNPYIETEHLLLGLWREDPALRLILNDTGIMQQSASRRVPDSQIRTAIEQAIGQHVAERVPISTSTGAPELRVPEVPLSPGSKKALVFAVEEADRFGQRYVGTEHLLLGILRVEDSFGAQIVRGRGLEIDELRERVAKSDRPVIRTPSLPILEDFLAGLKCGSREDLMRFFAKNAQVVDVHGKRWTYDEISKNFEMLFVPYAKKTPATRLRRHS